MLHHRTTNPADRAAHVAERGVVTEINYDCVMYNGNPCYFTAWLDVYHEVLTYLCWQPEEIEDEEDLEPATDLVLLPSCKETC